MIEELIKNYYNTNESQEILNNLSKDNLIEISKIMAECAKKLKSEDQILVLIGNNNFIK